nr:circularly permuted type 2 ATP-grasp protein [Nocardia sp. BMG111209]
MAGQDRDTRGREAARAVVAEFARYRAAAAETASYDACGEPVDRYYDELVGSDGRVRPIWSELSADFIDQGPDGLARLDRRVRRLVEDDGITYTEVGAGEQWSGPTAPAPDTATAAGSGTAADGPAPGVTPASGSDTATAAGSETVAAEGDTASGPGPAAPVPWRLDPIPLLVSADDWARLEAGLAQRSRVLDAVLADVYGPRRLLADGVLPPEIVFGSTGYIRAAHGITLPGRHQLFLHASDISRWGDGEFRVLTDWAQAPSGAGYVLADRRVVSAAVPEAFEHSSPRPLTPFARAMRLLLIEAAPAAADDPTVVVLSPGAHSETAFDQAYLASVLGFPLVESEDLVVRDGMLWMRSLGTLHRVDVVLRRVDAEFADPLDLRPDSRLGVVGLVEVLRRGAVTMVNTLGSGLLESPALAALLPRLARELLGEELLLPGAPSYWGGNAAERDHLLKHLDRLIIRSAVDGATHAGPALSAAQRAELAARIEAQGWQWVGQEPPEFSVAPAVVDGALTAAPVGVRLFSMAGRGGYRVLPGGLGQLHQRTQPQRSVLEVAAKDVWVRAAPVAAAAAAAAEPVHEERVRSAVPILETISSPRVLENLFWMGRYTERAQATVRLLIAIHRQYQDFRYRPWLEGGDAVPVLMAALSRVTGAPAPVATVTLPQPDPRAEAAADPERDQSPAPDRSLLPAADELELPPPQQQSRAAEHWRTAATTQHSAGRAARRSPEATAAQKHSNPESEFPVGPVAADAVPADPIAWSDRLLPPPPASQQASMQGADAPPGPEPYPPTPPRSDSAAGQHDPLSTSSEADSTAGPVTPRLDRSPDPAAAESAPPGGGPRDIEPPVAASSGRLGAEAGFAGSPADVPDGDDDAAGSQPHDHEIGGTGTPVDGRSAGDRERTESVAEKGNPPWRPSVVGASAAGYGYLARVTADRELPGSLAYAIEHLGADARAVRDQLSPDTWMVSSAMDRAMAEYRAGARDQEAALAELHAAVLAALLALSGIEAESMVRDTGWYVADIGKRIERGLALTALLAAAFTQTYPDAVQRIVTEAVLRATESMVSYRRRHRDSIRVAAVTSLLLFDAANPRSLAHQLERLETDLQALPGASGSSRPQRLLAEAQRMLSRLDPADLEVADATGRRTVFAELIDGVHLRLRTLSEAFETGRLAGPGDTQPLWGNTRVVE